MYQVFSKHSITHSGLVTEKSKFSQLPAWQVGIGFVNLVRPILKRHRYEDPEHKLSMAVITKMLDIAAQTINEYGSRTTGRRLKPNARRR